jgi:hypothetical protein
MSEGGSNPTRARSGKRKDGELLLNGSTTPAPLALRAGVRYRLRFIDILANNSIVINAIQDGKPVEWTSIAKDGADLASVQSVATPASFTIAPGRLTISHSHPRNRARSSLSTT